MDYKNCKILEKVTVEEIKNKLRCKYEKILRLERGVYIFGTALMGKYVYSEFEKNGIEVCGFIDNDEKMQNTLIMGLRVNKLKDIPLDATIIIGTLSAWNEIDLQLNKSGYKNIINYEVLALLDGRFQTYNSSFGNMFEDLVSNKDKILENLCIFQDEKSRDIYDLIIGFRLSLDINYTREAKRLSVIDGEQYFDNRILMHKKDEVFVDGGGFNGDTVFDFLRWSKREYKKILYFEPDQKMFTYSKKRLEKVEKIEFYNCGLGNENIEKYFDDKNHTSGGIIVEEGNEKVHLCCLDEFYNEQISFLKLDTEGYELSILEGAKRIIMDQKPKIAISAYHRPEDIYSIRKNILDKNSSYKLFCRHYTDVYADTVFYFI